MSLHIPEPVRWRQLDAGSRADMLRRPALQHSDQVAQQAREIIATVRRDGDQALFELTTRLDGVAVPSLEVCSAQIDEATAALDPSLREAMLTAIANIEGFHRAQASPALRIETTPGVVCERISQPLDAVGMYIPAGNAPLPSTVLMLAIPARLAGCPTRILCAPPAADGCVDATVLAAARLCDVQRVFAVGGAQAIAAMAYGTATIPRVARIFGPGNRWVTAAKSLVSTDAQGAAIDMPAGPSELMIVADVVADPAHVAADLLSQAEHGPDSQVVLLTDSAPLAGAVAAELTRQAQRLARLEIVRQSLRHGALIIVDDLVEAITIANDYAPEHLIVNVTDARSWLPQIRNAGSVFLGAYAPESVGDYCTGTNHVLPTYGWARSFSGVGLADFSRSISVQELTAAGLAAVGPAAQRLAVAEGLDGHANAIAVRLHANSRGEVA